MVCSATTVRDENCDTAGVDRHPEEGLSLAQDVPTDRCDQIAGTVGLLSAAERSNDKAAETEAAAQVGQSEVALHDLWFALPRQQQLQFGGQFSRMLLRAVELHGSSTTNEPELKS